MAKPWSEVATSDEFLSLPREERIAARRQYFDQVVAPQIEQGEHLDAWRQFDSETMGALDAQKRSAVGKAIDAFGAAAGGVAREAMKDVTGFFEKKGSVMDTYKAPAPKPDAASPVAPMRQGFYSKLADAERAAPEAAAERAGALSAPIDTSRPRIQNPDGSFSTERTITVERDGKHYLIPTIVRGKQLSEDEAIKQWDAGNNRPVGEFASADEAERGARERSRRIGELRGGGDVIGTALRDIRQKRQQRILEGADKMQPLTTEQMVEMGPERVSFDELMANRRAQYGEAAKKKSLDERVQGYLQQGVTTRDEALRMAIKDVRSGKDASEPFRDKRMRSPFGEWARSVGDALVYHFPAEWARQGLGAEASLAREGSIAKMMMDRSDKRAEEIRRGTPNADKQQVIPGVGFFTYRDIQEMGRSIPASLSSLATGLLIGGAPGVAVGATTAYAGMNRSDQAMLARELRRAADEDSIESRGRPLSDDEWRSRLDKLRPEIERHGKMEAIGEAGGTAAEIAILQSAAKVFGKGLLTRFATKLFSLGAMEVMSEAFTQTGQQQSEVRLGMRPGEQERSFASTADWVKSAREVAPQTLLLVWTVGGMAKGGQIAQERLVRDPKVAEWTKQAAEEGLIGSIPPNLLQSVMPTIREVASRRKDDADLQSALEVFETAAAKQAGKDTSLPAAEVLGTPEEAATAAPAPAAPAATGVESMLADPKALWAEATRRPSILNTIQQVVEESPFLAPEQKAVVAEALKAMQADPKAIFDVARARPEVYDTIQKAAQETARLERARSGAVAAPAAATTAGEPSAQPAPPTQAAAPLSPKESVAAAFDAAERRAAAQREAELARLQQEATRTRQEEAFEQELARAEAAGSGLRPESEVPQGQMEMALRNARIFGKNPADLTDASLQMLVRSGAPQVREIAQAEVERRQAIGRMADEGGRPVYSRDAAFDRLVERSPTPVERVADNEVSGSLKRAARFIENSFGKNVVFVRADPREFEGTVMSDDPGTLYVNTRAARAWKRLVGHEVLHALKRSNARIYNELLRSVAGQVKKGQAAKRYVDRYGDMPTDIQVEEMVADIFGDQQSDAGFWLQVFKTTKSPRALMNSILSALDSLRIKLRIGERRTGYRTDEIIRDIEAVRRAVAKAWTQWQEMPKEKQYERTGEPSAMLRSVINMEAWPDERLRRNLSENLSAIDRRVAQGNISPAAPLVINGTEGKLEVPNPADVSMYRLFMSKMLEVVNERLKVKPVRLESRPEKKPPPFRQLVEQLPKSRSGHIKGSGDMEMREVWNLVQRMERMAREGEHGKEWYTESAERILDAFDNNKAAAKTFAQIIAITSANTEVKANFTAADKALFQYAQGKMIQVGTQSVNDKLNDLLYFGIPWGGRKTNVFYTNLIEAISGEKPEQTTQDMHMGMIAFGKKQINDDEYTFLDMVTKHVAKRVNMTPQQTQAAVWVTQKARSLVERYETKGFHVDKSPQAKRRMAINDAGINYGSLIEGRGWFWPDPNTRFEAPRDVRARGIQVTAEVKPSTKLGIGQMVANLSVAKLQAYQKDAFEKVFGARGARAMMEEMGLDRTQYRVVEGAGGYDAMMAPNEIITLNTDAKTAERVAKAWMYVFKQDAVPFFRADAKLRADPNAAQAVKIRFAEPLTNKLLRTVYDSLREQVDPGIGFTKLDTNVIAIVNFRDSEGTPFLMSDEAFVEKLGEVVQRNNLGAKINGYGRFGAETSYPYHDWAEDREGAGLLAAAAGGRPDLQQRLRRWADVFQRYAEARGAREAKGQVAAPARTVDEAAHVAATSETNGKPEPTEAQKQAGNYHKGHVRVATLPVTIENPQGSTRTWKRPDGTTGESVMKSHYGYIRGTEGADGDKLDIFVKPDTPLDYNGPVFVIDQRKATGRFDEHKVMLGWNTVKEALAGYTENYQRGWDGHEAVVRFESPKEFKQWLSQAELEKRAAGQMLFSRAPQTEEFKKWFEGSKVTDERGEPLVVYHGTSNDADFKVFRVGQRGAYFTEDRESASSYAEDNDTMNRLSVIGTERHKASRVIPVYLAIKNPYVPTEKDEARMKYATSYVSEQRMQVMKAKLAGHDGIKLQHGVWVAFTPTQVKSAIGNRGTYDATKADMLMSRREGYVSPGDLAGAWRELAKVDEIFQRPRSKQRGMVAIAREIAPDVEVLKYTNLNRDNTSSWQILMSNGSLAFVRQYRAGGFRYHDGPLVGQIEPRRTIQLDASNMLSGHSRGSVAYDIVAQYAHNNGLVFIGDMQGITTLGAFRRVESMISSALKFGTTRHIEPHQFQRRDSGYLQRAKQAPIPWRHGDDNFNIRSLLEASYQNVRLFAPEIENIVYDFAEHRFKYVGDGDLLAGIDKNDITDEAFSKLAKKANSALWNDVAQGYAPQEVNIIGANTLKRAAMTNTLMRAKQEGWWNTTIGAIQGMADFDEGDGSLRGMLYSREAYRPRSDERPGERYTASVEWVSMPQNEDWVSITSDGRYEIEIAPDGFIAKVAGKEIGWFRSRAVAWKAIRDAFDQDLRTGAVKDERLAKNVLTQYSEDQVDSVVQGWRALAKNPSMFRFKKSDQKQLTKVIADMGLLPDVTEMHAQERPDGQVIDVIFNDATYATLVIDEEARTAYVNTTNLKRDSAMGTRFYQVVLTWAHNNGYRLVPDPAGLSYVNSFRRTEQMLSAALRFDDTRFMSPHADQGLHGWNDDIEAGTKEAQKSYNDENIALMAITSMRNVFEHVPRAASYRYDFEQKKIVDESGKPITAQDIDAMAREKGARNIGSGRTTVARAIFTNSLLHDEAGAKKVISGEVTPGMILSGDIEQSLQLYSRNDERFAPKKQGVMKRAALATVSGALQVARPFGAVATGLNTVSDLLMKTVGKPVSLVTGPLYDRFMRKAADIMEGGPIRQQIAHGLKADYGLPEPFVEARDTRDIEIQKHLRKSKQMLDKIAALDEGEAMVAYQWMQEKPNVAEEQRLLALLPEPSRQVLAEMKQTLSDLGQEAVDLRLLSQETYDRNNMAYLRRSYEKYEVENPQAVASSSRAKAIRAESFRGRGLRDDVDISRMPGVHKGEHYVRLEKRDVRPDGSLGPLKRVMYVKSGQAIPAAYAGWRNDGVWEARYVDRRGYVGMWRDLTVAERDRLGEIKEVRYAFARTMIGLVHDIETAKFLSWVGQNYSVADEAAVTARGGKVADAVDKAFTIKTYADNEWVQVPGTVAQGTRLFKYGALQSRYIPGHMWNDIRATVNMKDRDAVGKLYSELLRAWKISKTALSPAVHTNNIMANVVLSDIAEVNHTHIIRSLRVLVEAERGNEEARQLLERYLDSGAELGTPALHELRREVIEPLLLKIQGEENALLAQVSLAQAISLAAHGNVRQALAALSAKGAVRVAAKPFEVMLAAYQLEDSVYRLAKWLKEVDAGVSDRAAGKEAREAFLDYRINAPWVQALRRGPFPFFAFTYRVVPILAEALAKKPWKMMKYATAAYAVNALAYAMLGGDDEKEKRERAMLPDEKVGHTILGTPRLLRMPWNDEHGSPVFLDIRRWVPGGDIFDVSGSHSAIPLPQWLSFGGFWGLAIELASNKNQFTGKEIWKESDTRAESMVKVVDHLFRFFSPNVPVPNPLGYAADAAMVERGLLQTYSWRSIESAGTGQTDDFGRERTVPQATLNAIGVKLASYPEDQLRRNLNMKRDMELRDLSETTAKYRREFRRSPQGEQDRALFERRMQKQSEKKQEIQKRYGERMGLEPIQR